jgi:hypothetical protein
VLSVYVMGSSFDGERVRYWEKQLRTAGLIVRSTWSSNCESWAGKDARLPKSDQVSFATLNLTHLRDSHVCWYLSSQHLTRGSYVELGYALATRKPLYVSGRLCAATAYTALAKFRDPDDHLAFCEITRLAESLQPQAERAVQALNTVRPPS